MQYVGSDEALILGSLRFPNWVNSLRRRMLHSGALARRLTRLQAR